MLYYSNVRQSSALSVMCAVPNYTHKNAHTYTKIHTYMYMSENTHSHVHAHTNTYMHASTHTHIHTPADTCHESSAPPALGAVVIDKHVLIHENQKASVAISLALGSTNITAREQLHRELLCLRIRSAQKMTWYIYIRHSCACATWYIHIYIVYTFTHAEMQMRSYLHLHI